MKANTIRLIRHKNNLKYFWNERELFGDVRKGPKFVE